MDANKDFSVAQSALDTLKEEFAQSPGYIKSLKQFTENLLIGDRSELEYHTNIHDIAFNPQTSQIEIHFFIIDEEDITERIVDKINATSLMAINSKTLFSLFYN